MIGLLAKLAVPGSAAGVLAAQSTSSGFDPWSLLTTGGPVGILVAVFYLLLTGRLHTDGELKRLLATHEAEMRRRDVDIETERSARISLQTTLTTEVVPAVTRSTDATTRSTDLMEALARRQAGGD